MYNKADVNLLYELGQLAHIQRNYPYTRGAPTVAAHCQRVAIIALMLARTEKANVEKCLLMAIFHDATEVRTGDPSPFQKPFVKRDEDKAAETQFARTSLPDIIPLLKEYEHRETLEAKIVKDADMLAADLEMRELQAAGFNWPTAFEKDREVFLSKLRTESGRKLHAAIKQGHPFSWALTGPSSINEGTHGT